MLDTNLKKQIIKHFIISVFFFLFGVIYELFSHGVYSKYMIFAFFIPLILGLAFYTSIHFLKLNNYFNKTFFRIYNSSIYTFTLGCIIKGVLDIYGTTNKLLSIYFNAGVLLLVVAIIINMVMILNEK